MTETPRYISAPENCTGCSLCANVCSKDAITMKWNQDGFLVPEVDTTACINCGLCTRKCIALDKPSGYTDDTTAVSAFAAWAADPDIQKKSSSGGIFTPLAEQVLNDNGIVYGVIWQDKVTAVFGKAESPEELARMRGSKYTPAVPGLIYRDVKAQLKNGRTVLFSGTACQIYALQRYLGKEEPKLLTVEILCHGAPSHNLLEKYIRENEEAYNKTIDYICFRDKMKGWRNYHVIRNFTDGTRKACSQRKDTYIRLFLCNKFLNLSCYNCAFGHLPRTADITLGDYWGAHKHHPEWPIQHGISAIMANTDRGRNALSSLGNKIVLHPENFATIYRGQPFVYVHTPAPIPPQRSEHLEELRTKPLKAIYSKLFYAVDFGFIHISYRSGLYKYFNKIKNRLFSK